MNRENDPPGQETCKFREPPPDVKEEPLLLKLFAENMGNASTYFADIYSRRTPSENRKPSKHLAQCCWKLAFAGSNKQIPSKNSWNPTMSREVCGVRSFRETKIILQLVDPGRFALGASPPISQLPICLQLFQS